MAKQQTQLGTSGASNLIEQAGSLTAPVISGLQGQSGVAQGRQGAEHDSALTGFQGQQENGGFDPRQLGVARGNAANIAATGGYDPAALAGLQGSLQSATASGGYDPSLLQSLTTSGGYDPSTLAATRGGYQNFANNGGFTPEQSNQFINQATSGVGNTYAALQQQAKQQLSKTGGLGGGGALSQMARQLSQAQSGATLGAETSLNQQVNANKFSGLAGLNATNAGVAGNILSAGASSAGGRLAGLGAQAGLQGAVAQGRAGGVGQQIGLEGGVAGGRNAANSGLAGLYGTTTGQIGTLGQQVLGGLGLNFGAQGAGLGALTSLSKNPGGFQTAIGDIIGLGGAAGGILGAL